MLHSDSFRQLDAEPCDCHLHVPTMKALNTQHQSLFGLDRSPSLSFLLPPATWCLFLEPTSSSFPVFAFVHFYFENFLIFSFNPISISSNSVACLSSYFVALLMAACSYQVDTGTLPILLVQESTLRLWAIVPLGVRHTEYRISASHYHRLCRHSKFDDRQSKSDCVHVQHFLRSDCH